MISIAARQNARRALPLCSRGLSMLAESWASRLPSISGAEFVQSHSSLQVRRCSEGASTSRHRDCWKCHARDLPVNNPFCNSCEVIQPVATGVDYFALMGLKRTYDLDPKRLEEAFKSLQRHLHPDKFGACDEAEQLHSADHASQVNDAYSTLRSPLSRANYLLRLMGEDPDAEAATISDPELLMEVMETREAVEEAGARELAELRASGAARARSCEAAVSEAFRRADLAAAKAAARRLTYLQKVLEEIGERERAHETGGG